jgi:hypothetical protein
MMTRRTILAVLILLVFAVVASAATYPVPHRSWVKVGVVA